MMEQTFPHNHYFHKCIQIPQMHWQFPKQIFGKKAEHNEAQWEIGKNTLHPFQ